MNLINKKVTHKYFGTGSVIQQTDGYVEVQFKSGNKRFVFPDAFGIYLTLIDQRISEAVKKIKQKKEAEYMQAELKSQKERNLQYNENQKRLRQERFLKNFKIHSSSQLVFWCDEEEQKKVFKEWKIFTGIAKRGASKDKPIKPSRINQNSACLLTAREIDKNEADRRIIGLYMVNEDFVGKLCEDGYIPAHEKYRICLSKQEAKKMLFWNYYIKRKHPQNMVWNSGTSRYFDNIFMAQILRDITELKQDVQEREFMKSFFEHFCKMNQIHKNHIAKPNGALQKMCK